MFKKYFLQVVLAVFAACVAFAQDNEQPELTNARVTLPYSELKELWKAAQEGNRPPPAKPPTPAAVSSARYEIELRGDQAIGFVELEAQSFGDEWNSLPLLAGEMQVNRIEPPDANIVLRDGSYALLTNRPTKQRIRMHFVAAVTQEGDGHRVQFAATRAIVNLLSVKGIPPEKTLSVTDAILISKEKGIATFQLAPQERIGLQLLTAVKTTPVPSQWETSAQCLVQFTDDLLRYEAHLSASTGKGSGLGMELRLPAGARVITVTGDDIGSWRAHESSSESRTIAVQWRTAGILSRQINIVYELPQNLEGDWSLQAPAVSDGKSLPPIFAVSAGNEVELTPAGEALETRAPRWLAERVAGIPTAIITRSDRIQAKLLPVIEVAPALIETAQFNTRIVGDGSLISEQTYTIKTRASLVWVLEIPANSELLSCTVGGQRINPINRGEGKLEVAIAPEPGGGVSHVALSYTSRSPAFLAVSGRIKVELPKTPLLINLLLWDLAIPADYEVAALEGNVTPVSGAPAREGSTVVRLKKELCRNERPMLELFYQRPEVKK